MPFLPRSAPLRSSLPRVLRSPWGLRGGPLVALLLAVLTIPDCQSSEPPRPIDYRNPDRADNGVVSIDETQVVGSIDSGQLRLSIPIRSIDARGAAAALDIRIMDVTNATSLGETSVAYALEAGASSTLAARLPVPSGVHAQADLALYNVRIEQAASGPAPALRVTRSLLTVIPAYELRLEGPSSVTTGKNVSYRVRAEDPVHKAPVAGAKVSLDVLAKDGSSTLQSFDGQTSATGEVFFPLSLADAADVQVRARGVQAGVPLSVADAVSVSAPGPKILLTSDKPIYQPGQTIHLRSLTLTLPDDRPMANAPVLLEVEDGKGNKVMKRTVNTDAYGIASTDFTVGTLVNTGNFTLRATSASAKTEKTVSVSTYALPKFDVELQTDAAWYKAGATVTGAVDARYFFGKSVAGGGVVIQAATLDVGQTPFQNVMGTLDASGHFAFSVTLPATLAGTALAQGNASVNLHVVVTDTAGQAVTKDSLLTVSRDGLDVALVPEATSLVPGLANELDLFVSDPTGAPLAGAAATIATPDGQSLQATTDAYGQAALTWQAPADLASTAFSVTVAPSGGGAPVQKSFTFGGQTGGDHLIVRTDAAIYNVGDTVKVDVATDDRTRDVFVDWINAGQAVTMRTLTASAGHAGFTMPLDASLAGSNRVEAYVVDATGNVVRAGRTVFVTRDDSLSVAMTQDKPTYAPGDPATLTFAVTDSQGRPAVAALGVEIVDQAVFSLVDAHPGLLRTFFELDSIYATPTYEIAAPPVDYGQLLFTSGDPPAAAQARQTLTKASFAALGDGTVSGISHGSWTDVVAADKTLLQPAYTSETATLNDAVHQAAAQILEVLRLEGCSSYYCSAQGAALPDLLGAGLAKSFSAWDFWGNPLAVATNGGFAVTLTSRGPDETAGTGDDATFQVDLSDLAAGFGGGVLGLGGPQGEANAGAAAPGAARDGTGAGAGGGSSSGGAASSSGSSSGSGGGTGTTPRVRTDFPETLYVNPSVITGPDGTASIDVPLADSITEWRVSTMASTPDGKLGGGESGFKVFQDFFVDVNFPATLTRGDQVTFPIAVYNYLATPQTVSLSLSPDGWYTPAGATTTSVTLQPGEVTGVSFPVRVDQVGLHSLTVTAQGSVKSDAVARSVVVVPDGKPVADTSSGVLSGGASASHAFAFPDQAVPGSSQLYVEVYPAFLAQAVNGMDSLLRQPTGCFEQTTSTTWPDVLVLAYLSQIHALTPDVQLKAQSLISAGYQRLLTFEHPGGGFSWFGTQDPAPFVSVTAFGLMEFADMAKVADVDPAMLDRTRAWLLAQQQADGSWVGDRTEFFSFNTSTVRNTAFVLGALAAAGVTGAQVDRGVAYLRAHAADPGADAYTVALVASALQALAPTDPATDAAYAALDALAHTDGDLVHWDTGGTQTAFYQSGPDSDVAATALATYALLQRSGGPTAEGAIKYLAGQKDADGNFGSTQATIWTLRALLLAATRGTDGAVGTLSIAVDGAPAQTVALTADQSDVMTTVDLSSLAGAGSHDVSLQFDGTGKVSFNAVGKYNLPWSQVPAPPAGPLSIGVSYDKTNLYVNDTVHETVRIHNNTTSTENMVLATLGVPPGFSVATPDLDALVAAKTLSKYELTGKQLVLYVPSIAASADLVVTYGLSATMPVVASDGAAEVHPYYEPTARANAAAQTLSVAAR